MKNLKVMMMVGVLGLTVFTACTEQELNEEQQLGKEFEMVDKSEVQDPGSRGR